MLQYNFLHIYLMMFLSWYYRNKIIIPLKKVKYESFLQNAGSIYVPCTYLTNKKYLFKIIF